MILVTGATGQLGSATIDFLLKKIPATEIGALVRDENKAADLKAKGIAIRVGNYEDQASLLVAMQGVDKVLLISGTDLQNRLQHHKNAIDAAKEVGVKHLVYTSFARKTDNENSPLGIVATAHIETDKYLKASGIPYTIMLNGLYADVLPMFFGETVLETGIFLPAGEGKVAYTTRMDMAAAAANILAGEGFENKEYVIANTDNYAMQDAAALLSEITGKQVPYLNPSAALFANTLAQAGVPQEGISGLASFSEAIKLGEFETTHTDLDKLLGRKPTSLKAYFESVYGAIQ
jgi:NAD(P)H dehydrogenase (quinone)